MVNADNERKMPVITCFYCSSYATEELPLAINGDEVLLRLCRRHAKSRTRPRVEPAPHPQTVVSKPRSRGFRLLRSRVSTSE
jgi:hypothetical protein